jgi:HAD superfamily hydrolase (TIGR01549 family)
VIPQTGSSIEYGPWALPPVSTRPTGQRGRLTRRRGLIFDLDDTLYPRERFIRSGFAAVANDLQRRHGVPAGLVFKILSRSFTQGATGREFQVVCAELGLSQKEVPYMVRVFRAHKPNLWLPYESSETLRKLRNDGWKLAILTNGLPAVQAAKVNALALAPMVDAVVYAETVARGGKPDATAFQAVLDRLDLPAERCVMVGDDPACDIEGARTAGLRTMRLARPEIAVAPGTDADLVISNIADVPRLAGGLLELVTLDAA